jgi:ribosomal-protein-alanine N-acetyltransferase
LTVARIPPEDFAQSLELERLCFDSPWTLENLAAEFKRSFALPLGAYQGRRLIAQSLSWLLPPECLLLNLSVHPDWRGRGLAKRLLRQLVSICLAAKINSIQLEANVNNLPALSFYRRTGFKRVGSRPGYYPDGADAVLLTLTLNSGWTPQL